MDGGVPPRRRPLSRVGPVLKGLSLSFGVRGREVKPGYGNILGAVGGRTRSWGGWRLEREWVPRAGGQHDTATRV